MSVIAAEIGRKIRSFRKMRGLTLEQAAARFGKTASALSKCEKGAVAIDVDSLYAIAEALGVQVEQLLCAPPERPPKLPAGDAPAFFSSSSRFFGYLYDGRNGSLIRCAFDMLAEIEPGRRRIAMYINFSDYARYQQSENSYWGFIEHYDAVTNIALTNQDLPMERASVQILAPYLNAETKWGLFNGFSTRPMMPIAAKMLLSPRPLTEDAELIRRLKISKEDIRLLRLYNMLPVT